MILEEPHEECNITPDRDAITEMYILIIDEVIGNAKVVEIESNGFENVKETKTIHVEYIVSRLRTTA